MAAKKRGISRRGLLIGGGAAVGLVVAWQAWPRRYAPNLVADEGETLFNAFLKIGTDGRVIVAVPQAELGQGSWTALPQILADELGADWRTVGVEPAPLSPLYVNQLLAGELAHGAVPGLRDWTRREQAERSALMLTGGSTSVRAFEPRLREAGAGARALLQMAAAERWGANWEELDTRGGFVLRGDDRIPFAELAGAAAGLELPEHLPVRGGLEHRLAGQPLPRLDTPGKIDGSARFAADVRLRDMVYASIRTAPPGGRLLRYDREAATRVPGMLRAVSNPRWLAAVATNWWAANRGLDAMAPQFSVPRGGGATNDSMERALAAALVGGAAERIVATGDWEAQLAANDTIRADYAVDPAPSVPMETLSATARIEGDLLEIWAATQAPGLARAAAARATGFDEASITIHPMPGGAGYGRRFETDAIEQAALIAMKMGRPVQLTWSRVQEIRNDRFRPPAAARMAARFGNSATIAAWQARIVAPRATAGLLARLQPGRLFAASDEADVAGAVPPYGIPAVSIERVPVDVGIEPGAWRSGAHSYTCFFTECFIDELARRASIEPVSFRMQLLGENQRLAQVLTQAAMLGGWDGGPPGSGIGIACHSAYGSHIALLVEVEIGADQRIRVLRAVAAVDCGRVINPELVKQQVEGGIVHGIAAATGRPLRFAHGVPTATTLADLGLPVLANAPEITVEIMPSQEEPGGVTELGVPPAGPAVASALASLTGRRLRRLPLVLGSRM